MTIGLPTVVDETVAFPLSLDFTTVAGEELVFFSLDVSGSDPALTAGGTDFSAFSFAPASPTLDGFDQVPGAEFGVGSTASVSQYDTITTPLSPATIDLGTLMVDYSGSGLATSDFAAVSLAGPDSVIGVEAAGDPGSFRFIDFQTLSAPESFPIDLVAADESDFLLTVVSGGSDSTSVSGSPSNLLGAERAVSLEFAPGETEGVLVAAKNPGEDVLDFVASAGGRGVLELTYGAAADLDSDFTLGGNDPFNAVVVDFASVDGEGMLTLLLESNGVEVESTLSVLGAGPVAFPFINYSGIDFASIDTVTVTLQGASAAADFSIREIVLDDVFVIPEPASTTLLAAATVALTRPMRRRARS